MEDSQIIALVLSGQKDSIGLLYDKYFGPIYRFFYWQVNNNKENAEDLTQDTFLEMAKSLKNFKNKGNFRNWLYTIAKRKLNLWIHNKYKIKEIALFENIIDRNDWIDPEIQEKKVKALGVILSRLSEREERIIRLRYLRNYSVKETAEKMQLSQSNIKIISLRGIKKLRAIFKV